MSTREQAPYREVQLAKGRGVALVDEADYEFLKAFRWFSCGDRKYASRFIRSADGKYRHRFMHRDLIEVPGDMVVDHINHNGLDNRRANLRLATQSQNQQNAPKRFRRGVADSPYKGVHLDLVAGTARDRWRAMIRYGGKQHHIGNYDTQESAARAYDRAAREHFGEFAYLNFPDEVSDVA